MRKELLISLAVFALGSFPSTGQAQGVIRFIASYGNDANPCTRTAPCRSMQAGVDATPDGSELQVLDSGGYGQNVSITKSITISANGVRATLATTSGISITINAPGKTVTIKGLLMTGLGTGAQGLGVSSVGALYLDRCEIERFTLSGALIQTSGQVVITDCIVRQNNSAGMAIQPGAGVLQMAIERSQFLNNIGSGVDFGGAGTVEASITDSISAGNSSDGFSVATGAKVNVTRSTAASNGSNGFIVVNSNSQLNIDRSVSRGNGVNGVLAQTSGTARLSNSIVTNNQFGIVNNAGLPGTFESVGNNTVQGNTTNIAGTITVISGT